MCSVALHSDKAAAIRGLRLRELLVLILLRAGVPMTVAELVAAVHRSGFDLPGRPGKVISDQLRYEVGRGRVRQVCRGTYEVGTVTRQATHRMRRRISELRRRRECRAPGSP